MQWGDVLATVELCGRFTQQEDHHDARFWC